MQKPTIYAVLKYLIAAIWLVNGLLCKVLNLVPRHAQIVSQILGSAYSRPLTLLIGISEIIMVAWILSGFKPKLNALTQIFIIAVMNVLEFILVPELLLWGKFNAIFAAMLILVIYYNEFVLGKKYSQT